MAWQSFHLLYQAVLRLWSDFAVGGPRFGPLALFYYLPMAG
jgi:hypothetical protein